MCSPKVNNYELDPLPFVTRTIELRVSVQILVVCVGEILQWEESVWVINRHRDSAHLTSNDHGHASKVTVAPDLPVLTRKRAPLGLTLHASRDRDDPLSSALSRRMAMPAARARGARGKKQGTRKIEACVGSRI